MKQDPQQWWHASPAIGALWAVYLVALLGGHYLVSRQYDALDRLAMHTRTAFFRHLGHLRQTLGQMEWLAEQASPLAISSPGRISQGKLAWQTAEHLQKDSDDFEPSTSDGISAAAISVHSTQTRLERRVGQLHDTSVFFSPRTLLTLIDTYRITQHMTTQLRQEHGEYRHTFRGVLLSFYWQWGSYAAGVTLLLGLFTYATWCLVHQPVEPATLLSSPADRRQLTRLQHDVVEISEHEQRRIGQDLHDSVGQLLTGIAFLSQGLAQKLVAQGLGEAAEAQYIGQLLKQAMVQTRDVAKGLVPAMSAEQGLTQVLHGLAMQTQSLFGIACHLQNDLTCEVYDHTLTIHFYRIAQEAIHNAIRHGQAKAVVMTLYDADNHLTLGIRDDGRGLPDMASVTAGLGLRTMQYRANLLGGKLILQGERSLGTQVICVVPRALQQEKASQHVSRVS